VRLYGDFLPKGEGRGGLLGSLAECLAFLWAVDATEADAFSVAVVQDFDGVAIIDSNNRSTDFSSESLALKECYKAKYY
jgi:hypothetical protein